MRVTCEHMRMIVASAVRQIDTYDEDSFSSSHSDFKASHNAMFIDLARYCTPAISTSKLFFLDGPSGKTTASLLAAGFERSQLWTANWHDSTCAALSAPPHSLASERVAPLSAEEALRSCFRDVPFTAAYLDGCSGQTAPLIACVHALFDDARLGTALVPRAPRHQKPSPAHTIAIGFTLAAAEPSGRSLADREVDVHRAIYAASEQAGYAMAHVSDAPTRYGADEHTCKRDGSVMTSWVVLEHTAQSDRTHHTAHGSAA